MDVPRRALSSVVAVVCVLAVAGCAPSGQRVRQASERAASWAVTVKAVTEQWAQSHVSLRFTRTTLNTAISSLYRDAESIRSLDPSAAAGIDRLKHGVELVLAAVALNEPDRARDAAARLPASTSTSGAADTPPIGEARGTEGR
jgi:hypothetical protein